MFFNYSYKFNIPLSNKSNIIFFISECDSAIYDFKFYDFKLKSIINDLKKNGFYVVVKGHPRIGIPESIREISDYEIPSYVPGEFINIEEFKFCLGLDTNAICYFAKSNKLPTYSLIRMFPTLNIEMIEILVNFLKNQSGNKIKFIDNDDQFYTFIENILSNE